jgi:hypothetical protein
MILKMETPTTKRAVDDRRPLEKRVHCFNQEYTKCQVN